MRSTLRRLATITQNTPKPITSTNTNTNKPTQRTKPTPKSPTSLPSSFSLDHFIQRTRVLALYREIVRSLYRIPSGSRRSEPLAYARGEFVRNKDVRDIAQIRYLISTGKTEWDGMRRYVDEMAALKR